MNIRYFQSNPFFHLTLWNACKYFESYIFLFIRYFQCYLSVKRIKSINTPESINFVFRTRYYHCPHFLFYFNGQLLIRISNDVHFSECSNIKRHNKMTIYEITYYTMLYFFTTLYHYCILILTILYTTSFFILQQLLLIIQRDDKF